MNFQYTCVDCNYNGKEKELFYIIDHSIDITRDTFLKYVDRNELRNIESHLGYDRYLPMSKDWHVSYFKSRLPTGRPVYGFVHSAIEFVFY
jgi:hypothetical protein